MSKRSNLRIYTQETVDRIRFYKSRSPDRPPLEGDERLLAQARFIVRRRMWLRVNLPITILLSIPGFVFIGTRSSRVLFLFVITSPLLLVIRTLLHRVLISHYGDEEQLVREQYNRLRGNRLQNPEG